MKVNRKNSGKIGPFFHFLRIVSLQEQNCKSECLKENKGRVREWVKRKESENRKTPATEEGREEGKKETGDTGSEKYALVKGVRQYAWLKPYWTICNYAFHGDSIKEFIKIKIESYLGAKEIIRQVNTYLSGMMPVWEEGSKLMQANYFASLYTY